MRRDTPPMQVTDWLESAGADAERRGLPELKPLLDTLARSTLRLRQADERLRPDLARDDGDGA